MPKKKETEIEVKAVEGGVCPNCGKGKLTKRGKNIECSSCYAWYLASQPTKAEKIAELEKELAAAKAE